MFNFLCQLYTWMSIVIRFQIQLFRIRTHSVLKLKFSWHIWNFHSQYGDLFNVQSVWHDFTMFNNISMFSCTVIVGHYVCLISRSRFEIRNILRAELDNLHNTTCYMYFRWQQSILVISYEHKWIYPISQTVTTNKNALILFIPRFNLTQQVSKSKAVHHQELMLCISEWLEKCIYCTDMRYDILLYNGGYSHVFHYHKYG
jgi:hypothetical protein